MNPKNAKNPGTEKTISQAPREEAKRLEGLLVGRLMMSLISLVVVGLGVVAIVTEQYQGHNSKIRGADVAIYGQQAVLVGLFLVFLGLMPLALWFKTKRMALMFVVGCAVMSGAFLILAFC